MTRANGARLVAEHAEELAVRELVAAHELHAAPIAHELENVRRAQLRGLGEQIVAVLGDDRVACIGDAVELAKLAGLSLRQVQRMFQESLDTTPSKYYLSLRLRRARELLLQSQMSITQIAVSCGFQSTCHFSKSYRALYGRTPRSERQQTSFA